jgi:hypothetical protein
MVRRLSIAFALLAATVAQLAAQAPSATEPAAVPSAPRTLVGTWEFSNAGRDKICSVTFRAETSRTGKKVEFGAGCGERFPFIKEVVGWSYSENDFLRLLDANGTSVLEFSEVESGIFEAPRPGEGILFIQSAASAEPAPRSVAQMAGDWTVVNGAGKPICTLTLSDTPSGEEFLVRIQPRCDAAITRFAPAAWQMDRGALVLNSASGEAWRFEFGDDEQWRRVPPGTNAMLMRR